MQTVIRVATRLRALAIATALAATAASVHAADTAPEPLYAVVDVELAADGKVLAVEPADAVAGEVAPFLREQVSRWEFTPATLDGRPAPTRTSVTIVLEPTGTRNGRQMEVRIVDAATGPRYLRNPPPRYPSAAFDRRDTGEVLLRVDFDREGRVVAAEVERSAARKYFENAALAAVRDWTFQPERVGDVGIPASVLVPVRFCITGKPCRSLPKSLGEAETTGPRLVGEPAARIRNRAAAG